MDDRQKEAKTEIEKFNYLKNEKSFFDEIKSIFHSFWRAIIWWKNRNLIKIADTSFKGSVIWYLPGHIFSCPTHGSDNPKIVKFPNCAANDWSVSLWHSLHFDKCSSRKTLLHYQFNCLICSSVCHSVPF